MRRLLSEGEEEQCERKETACEKSQRLARVWTRSEVVWLQSVHGWKWSWKGKWKPRTILWELCGPWWRLGNWYGCDLSHPHTPPALVLFLGGKRCDLQFVILFPPDFASALYTCLVQPEAEKGARVAELEKLPSASPSLPLQPTGRGWRALESMFVWGKKGVLMRMTRQQGLEVGTSPFLKTQICQNTCCVEWKRIANLTWFLVWQKFIINNWEP